MEDGGDTGPEDAERYRASLEHLRDAATAVVDAIDDLVLEVLRDAAEEGRESRPALERRLTRARNGIERARRLLEDG